MNWQRYTKRLMFGVLILLSFSLLISACGTGATDVLPDTAEDTGAPVVGEDPADVAPVEITFWHLESVDFRVEAYEKLADAFMAENPDVKVNIEVQSWGDAVPKLLAAAESDVLPDISQASASMALTMWESGKLQPVDSIVNAIDSDHSYLAENLRDKFYVWDDHYWAVPVWSQSIMLYYRSDLLNAAGLQEPTNWDELLLAAEALTKDGSYGLNLPSKKAMFTDENAHALMHTNGVRIFDENGKVVFNSPETVETLEYYQKLAEFASPDSLQMDWAESENNFATGKTNMGMFFGNVLDRISKDNPDWGGEVRSMAIPTRDTDDYSGTETFVISMMVFSEDPVKFEASQRFLEFMMEPESYIPWLTEMGAGTTFLPITETGASSPDFKDYPAVAMYWESVQAEIEASKNAEFYGFYYGPNPDIGPVNATNIIAEVFQKVYLGELTPEEAAVWGQEQIEALITG